MEQPRGTVAFLFTDVEGSTRLWQSYPDRMPAAYYRHDVMLRGAIAEQGGVVYKTIGDAFQAAFPSTTQAVAAAVAAQRALSASMWPTPAPIRVRMALHTGAVDPDEHGDYRSPVLNRLGRLLGAGHGGQVLVSEAVTEQLPPDALPPGSPGGTSVGTGSRTSDAPSGSTSWRRRGSPRSSPSPSRCPPPATGGLTAVGIAVLVLILFPVATGAAEFGPSLFSPRSLLEQLTGLVLQLATLREHVLLVLTALLALLTAPVTLLWWRGGRVAAGAGGGLLRIAGRRVGLRTVTFLAAAAVLVLGAYGYQQYLWRVALPIPAGAIGVALSREASAASFDRVAAHPHSRTPTRPVKSPPSPSGQ